MDKINDAFYILRVMAELIGTGKFMRRMRLCVCCCAMMMCVSPAAATLSKPLALTFQSSATCATEEKFNLALEGLLSDWQGQSSEHFTVLIENTADNAASQEITLKVTDSGQTFQRKVVINNCDLAPRVAALLVALTLDPATLANMSDTAALDALSAGERAGTDANTAPRTGGEEAAPPGQVDTTAASTDARDAPGPWHSDSDHGVSLWLNTTFFALPRGGAGPAVEYSWRRHRIAPMVDGRFSFSAEETISRDQTSAALRLWLFSVHAGAELQVARKRWFFSPRLGMGMHVFLAKAIDFPEDFQNVQTVFTPWMGGIVRFRITEIVGLMAVVNADWLVTNVTYRLAQGEAVHETGHFLFQVGFGFFHFF